MPTSPSSPGTSIQTDGALFQLITQTDAFGRYTLFPNADELTTGRLNGSEAHHPVIRVSLNAIAAGALQNGRLPLGARFPEGSIVFTEIRPFMLEAGQDTIVGQRLLATFRGVA